MQNPAETLLVGLATSLETEDAFKVGVAERCQRVPSLFSNPVDLLETEIRRATFAREALRILQHVPVGGAPIFIRQLMAGDIALNPPPFGLADVQHESTDRVRSRYRAPADLLVSHAGDRFAQLLAHFFHTCEIKTDGRRNPRSRIQNVT